MVIKSAVDSDGNNTLDDEIEVTENSGETPENLETNIENESDEVTITIGEVSPASEDDEDVSSAPEWVKEVRKTNRELKRQNRELQEKLKSIEPETKVQEIGYKPTLEACDYDADKFETELLAWNERKREIQKLEDQKKIEADTAKANWQTTLKNYENASKELKVKDFNDAEDVVKETLSVVQQGIILQGASNSALVIYALGKDPKKSAELAAIKDPVKFAFAIANLEGQIKVKDRKAPPPEKSVRSGGSAISGTVDSTLERLRAEAEKSGNYSKVLAYKNQLKAKGK